MKKILTEPVFTIWAAFTQNYFEKNNTLFKIIFVSETVQNQKEWLC